MGISELPVGLLALHMIFTLVELADTCQLFAYGGIGQVDMGPTVGCTMACFGPKGQQVHILHETQMIPTNAVEQIFVMTTLLPEGVEMALVLASFIPVSWIFQLTPKVNISSIMLISKFPLLTNISFVGTGAVVPKIIRENYSFITYQHTANAMGIIHLAEHQYGLVTSYTEAEYARLWRLRATIAENPCTPADGIILRPRPPPYPHPTLPPIPTELVTEAISTAGSVFIGVMLTIVLGFVPLFLCLCCLCFRARRNRSPQGGASVGLSSVITSPPGHSGVVYSGADPVSSDLPPAYELSIRPAIPPAPPDYEKLDDDLPPPYSAVVAAMKNECIEL